jgi:protoheme IX farnesyltransferase
MLAKLRLASSVVFSAMAGYLLGADQISISALLALLVGGFLVVGASNAYNQVIEKYRDAKMDRTKDRPVAAGRMSVAEALIVASLMGVGGLGLLYSINPMSAGFGALSIFIYVLVYTPMKAVSAWAVFIGAFPGAIPYMLGWVAATNKFGIEPGTLFAIQFMWQFPHFWAIAWLVHDDYLKAGYNLLPTGRRDGTSALMALIYSVGLVAISIVPAMGITGTLFLSPFGLIGVLVSGIYLIIKANNLLKQQTKEAAKTLMYASILYLTLVQIIFVVDKYVFH